MRITLFKPNERVDLPDLTASQTLPLGEFRRNIRSLFLGADEMKIINGFAVEANGPPDSAIVVKLDPGGGGWLSHALLAEGTNFGQLAGGADDQAQTEGNATYPVDFAGQPAATYTVEMRFTYAEGDNQNRAFINPTTEVESVAATPTRLVPTLEVRLIPVATGGEWMALATVVWNGATISTGDITDLRDHALEAGPTFQATSWGGAGGMPDFSRNVARSDAAHGLFALIPYMRALGRQIQDLKGFNASGALDMFSRVRTIPAAGTGTVSAEQTRSISSMDTEEFTVGDGTTTFGDFNGSDGLQLCLDHVALNKATLFKHVTIKVTTRDFAGGVIQTLATPVDLSGVRVTIDCVTGNLAKGRLNVDFTHGAGAFFTSTTSDYPLEIRNMSGPACNFANTIYPLFDGGNANGIVLHNCSFQTTRTLALPIVTARSLNTRVTDCDIQGEIRLGAGGTGRSCVIDGVYGNNAGLYAAFGVVRLYQTLGVIGEQSIGVTIRRSFLRQIDGRGAQSVTVEGCTLSHAHDDGIILGRTVGPNSFNWSIKDCSYIPAAVGASGHVTTNGSKGTGWSVHCIDSAGASGDLCTNIKVSGVHMLALSGTDSGVVRLESVRGGVVEGVQMNGLSLLSAVVQHGVEVATSEDVIVRGCNWEGITSGGAATLSYRCVSLVGTNTGIRIVDNTFDAQTGLASTTSMFHVKAEGDGSAVLTDVKILRNRFLNINDNGASFEGNAHVSVGQAAPTFSAVAGFEVSDCRFTETSAKFAVFIFNGIGTLTDVRVERNTKKSAGSFVQVDSAVLGCSISHNRFEPGTGSFNSFARFTRIGNARVHIANNHLVATNALSGLITFTGANSYLQLMNNTLFGITNNALALTGDTTDITVIGNYCNDATAQIISTTPPVSHLGWGNATLNRATFV